MRYFGLVCYGFRFAPSLQFSTTAAYSAQTRINNGLKRRLGLQWGIKYQRPSTRFCASGGLIFTWYVVVLLIGASLVVRKHGDSLFGRA
jgi:hypothetical protein